LDLALEVAGLHYNPKYWEDPFTFKPERFLGDWNRDAFLAFSGGYRGCVGRKFSETEGAAVLTILISQFIVSIKDEPQFASETYEQRKARVLDARAMLTLAPIHLPLVFRRRT
jgi:cytochrome P450